MTGTLKGVLFAVALVAVAGCGGDKKTEAAGGDGNKGAPAPAAGGAGGGAKYDAAKSTASVKLTVKWSGTKPAPVAKVVTGDAFCTTAAAGKTVMDERFTVNENGTLPNTMVWASKGPHKELSGFPAGAPFTLDQHGCMYVPHVFGVRTGQAFAIKNSDGTKHNVHAHPSTNPDNLNLPQDSGKTDQHTFNAQEAGITFNCDIHSWMSSVGFVFNHPFYAVTDASGVASISGLPAGTYTFKVWHEGFTPAQKDGIASTVDVTVKDGEAAAKDVDLK